ncbi:MAG: hypothetical protein ACFCVB_12845 [Nodosilinea sp.]
MLAGTEVRSAARRRQDAARHPLWTPINLMVIAGTTALGILALLALLQITNADLSVIFNPKTAPAGIPFKADRSSCKASGRTWREEGCFDFSYAPTF